MARIEEDSGGERSEGGTEWAGNGRRERSPGSSRRVKNGEGTDRNFDPDSQRRRADSRRNSSGNEEHSDYSDEGKEKRSSSRGSRRYGRREKEKGCREKISDTNREHKLEKRKEGEERTKPTGDIDDLQVREDRDRDGRKLENDYSSFEDDTVDAGGTGKRRGRKREKSDKRSDRRGSRRKRGREKYDSEAEDTSASDEASSSSTDISDSEDEAQKEKERRRRKKRKRKEKERELEREMQRKVKKKKMKELKEKELKSEKKKKKRERRAKQPITKSWGKYGILKDIDMWNKRPEFSAWLAEVKKVNMETLSSWEEKQMFKEYMEDYNTATFPSKKYYNLDIYHRRKVMKARTKGLAKLGYVERTDFNDEEQRRQELRKEREQQKEADIEALMKTMQSGMAQAMREQAQLREEMQYQFRLGNVDAAQAIQRRLDPDAEKFGK